MRLHSDLSFVNPRFYCVAEFATQCLGLDDIIHRDRYARHVTKSLPQNTPYFVADEQFFPLQSPMQVTDSLTESPLTRLQYQPDEAVGKKEQMREVVSGGYC